MSTLRTSIKHICPSESVTNYFYCLMSGFLSHTSLQIYSCGQFTHAHHGHERHGDFMLLRIDL